MATSSRAAAPVAELRKAGLNLAVDLSGRKLGDQMKAADKKGLKYVLIIGEDELKTGKFKLKVCQPARKRKLDLKGVAKKLKDQSRVTATNHAMTGAVIGLVVGEPLIAMPAA